MRRFDFRNVTVIVGAALFFPLIVGKPFFPEWFRPYAHLTGFLVASVMFSIILLYNKFSTGMALPMRTNLTGQANQKANISKFKIFSLIFIFILAAALPIFHLFRSLLTSAAG